MSWHRARWACQNQNKRLCTANEYRDACAGSENWVFPYGQYWAAVCNDGWSAPSSLAPTGSHESCTNDFGCYDMSGNLWEWVHDWYGEFYYEAFVTTPAVDPQGPAIGDDRVLRGGSFGLAAESLRVTHRLGFSPAISAPVNGFRCCR